MPVADETAHLRVVAQFLPAAGRDSLRANRLAAAGPVGQGCRTGDSADPKSAYREEVVEEPATGSQQRRNSKLRRKNQPSFDLESELRRVFGVDLTHIDGIKVMTAQVILAELGPDLSAFPSEGQFASWLELVPRRNISGQSDQAVIARKQEPGSERISYGGAVVVGQRFLFRRPIPATARENGGRERVKAMAHYLACLVHRLLTKGQASGDRGAAYFENQRSEREITRLKR